MITEDDDFRWNAFRSHKRANIEKLSLTPWMITCLQATKLLLFLFCNTFLTVGAAVSKICVLILATNLWEKRYTSNTYARRCSRVAGGLPLQMYHFSCSIFFEPWRCNFSILSTQNLLRWQFLQSALRSFE
ncbi:unnamed protein product [Cylicostephanus goldi]|uniref:Chitin synthase chs-1/2 N-terminal putative transporter domain-containing protein n=1 Tax=Cylicostephanus goldi TaxID=71465 RepID=A0A3P6TMX7_CYLGO|nr:unnamed protein product [Cylicostephanus goldi]